MAQFYRYGGEPQCQGFSNFNENQCLSTEMANAQSYYTAPVVAGTHHKTHHHFGQTAKPTHGYNHNMGGSKFPATEYQQATYSEYEMDTRPNLAQTYAPAPVTGYHGKHHESHEKKTYRKKKYSDGSSTVEYSSCSESDSDDEGRARRYL